MARGKTTKREKIIDSKNNTEKNDKNMNEKNDNSYNTSQFYVHIKHQCHKKG